MKTVKLVRLLLLLLRLINTFQGITAELATKTATPFEFGLKISNIAATTAIGFKAVKDILKTSPKSASAGGARGPGGGAPARPSFNIVGQGGSSQIAGAIGQQTNDLQQEPIKAYVVSSEVTSQQALDRQVESNATIG